MAAAAAPEAPTLLGRALFDALIDRDALYATLIHIVDPLYPVLWPGNPASYARFHESMVTMTMAYRVVDSDLRYVSRASAPMLLASSPPYRNNNPFILQE